MKTVKEEMDRDIREEDLKQIHCVGNPKVFEEGKPRPIIVKLLVMMCVVQCIKIKRS